MSLGLCSRPHSCHLQGGEHLARDLGSTAPALGGWQGPGPSPPALLCAQRPASALRPQLCLAFLSQSLPRVSLCLWVSPISAPLLTCPPSLSSAVGGLSAGGRDCPEAQTLLIVSLGPPAGLSLQALLLLTAQAPGSRHLSPPRPCGHLFRSGHTDTCGSLGPPPILSREVLRASGPAPPLFLGAFPWRTETRPPKGGSWGPSGRGGSAAMVQRPEGAKAGSPQEPGGGFQRPGGQAVGAPIILRSERPCPSPLAAATGHPVPAQGCRICGRWAHCGGCGPCSPRTTA